MPSEDLGLAGILFCYWPTGWRWWNHFWGSKTLLYLFQNLMKKRILRHSFIVQMVMVVLYNHHDRKSCSKKIVWRVCLLPVVWKIVWLAFPTFSFFSLWDSVLLWKNILFFFFSSRNVISFYNKHLLQLCLYLVTFIKFFMRGKNPNCDLFWRFLVNVNSDNLKHNHSSPLQAQSYLVFLTSAWKINPVKKAVVQGSCRAGRVRRHLLRLRAGGAWSLVTPRKGGGVHGEVSPVPAL